MNKGSSRLTLMAVIGMLGLASMILQAATGPIWWVTRGVVSTNAVPNDFAAVNQGQLKWMAANAASELESQLPGGAGSNVWALVNSLSNTNNYRPVNLGQLKYVAQPFYDRLIQVGYTTNYPWNASTNAPNDYALANIGQVKNVFSFDAATWMTLDTDNDGIPDWWMFQNFGHATGQSNDLSRATDDADGDGSTNFEEYQAGSNPRNENSMPPDNPVYLALDSFNYTQVNLLRAVAGLAPTAWISSTNNNSAKIAQLRTSIKEIIPNCLDFTSNFYDTNAVPYATLQSVLSLVGNTSATWSQGPLTNQVNELTAVVENLSTLPSEGETNMGALKQGGNLPQVFGTWTVDGNYPTRWASYTNFNVYECMVFSEKYNDHCFSGYMSVNDNWYHYSNVYGFWLMLSELYDGESVLNRNGENIITAQKESYNNNYEYCSAFKLVYLLSVPTVKAKFQAKEGEINHGFDPTEVEPWTSVGVGSTNQIVQLNIGGWPANVDSSDIVLAVKSGDESKISVTPTNNFSDGVNSLTINGLVASTNAKIEVKVKGCDAAIATLHVMVLQWTTNSIGIYRIVDMTSSNTLPAQGELLGPSAANIINDLNSVFAQACVHLELANPDTADGVKNIWYDNGSRTNARLHVGMGGPGIANNGMMEYNEEPACLQSNSVWSGDSRIFIFKTGNMGCGGYTPVEPFPDRWCVVFTQIPPSSYYDQLNIMWCIRHEVGHNFGLATRNQYGEHHDQGPPPLGTDMLMRTGLPNPEPIWMRHDDWDEANRQAKARTK